MMVQWTMETIIKNQRRLPSKLVWGVDWGVTWCFNVNNYQEPKCNWIGSVFILQCSTSLSPIWLFHCAVFKERKNRRSLLYSYELDDDRPVLSSYVTSYHTYTFMCQFLLRKSIGRAFLYLSHQLTARLAVFKHQTLPRWQFSTKNRELNSTKLNNTGCHNE
jgi:hypothetical protein